MELAQMCGKYPGAILEMIRRRAAELYGRGGSVEGHDQENWFRAEAEVIREFGDRSKRPAVVIHVGGVVYTGEYESASADGYTPGEWKAGDAIPVRFSGDKLFLRRANGRELEITVVKRIG